MIQSWCNGSQDSACVRIQKSVHGKSASGIASDGRWEAALPVFPAIVAKKEDGGAGGYSLLNTGVSFAPHLLLLSLHGYSCFSQQRGRICYDFSSLYSIFKKSFTKEPSTVPDTRGIAQEMGTHGCVCFVICIQIISAWVKKDKQADLGTGEN